MHSAPKAPSSLQVLARALDDWWSDWVQMTVVSILWTLSWLTVVLGPPATFGLFYVAHRMAYGESPGLGGMLEGARRYLLPSYLWALLNLVAAFTVYANLWFYGRLEASWAPLLQAFFWILGGLWLAVQFYALAYLMEQERKSLPLALRNGLFTILAAPGYSLVVMGAALSVAAVALALVAPLVLGGPGLLALIAGHAVRDRIETYGLREREVKEEVKREE
ncbi:MAG: hypothetical protein RMK65_00085 [Anaerolineae bacterium]|nr:hypothetical protein [Anaerolineae bacterium]MDW7990556.1 hypothetical protein [Anaerolineae bacterium]